MIATPPADDGADAAVNAAVNAAVANAALEGIVVEPDEQALIRQRQRGEITHEQFLARARMLAIDKTSPRE